MVKEGRNAVNKGLGSVLVLAVGTLGGGGGGQIYHMAFYEVNITMLLVLS